MNMSKVIPVLLLTIILVGFVVDVVEARGTGEENVRIIKASSDSWTCYDYSVDFAKNNPGWGIVTICPVDNFDANSHMVNYLYVSEDLLIIHDGYYDSNYLYWGWQYTDYYHFWINETPKRNYVMMRDNRNDVNK
jgi:hypothetical protein